VRYGAEHTQESQGRGIKEPVILVSTDLSLTAAHIIDIYAARFSLEIAIRDLKQHFGFEDYQATTTTAMFRRGNSAAPLFASGN